MNCELFLSFECAGRITLSRYHHLNHYSIFGGGYRSGAVSLMRSLLDKYREGG